MGMVISEAFSVYVRYQTVERGYSTFTVERTKSFCRKMVRQFGDIDVSELTEDGLKSFQRLLHRHSKSPVTYYNRVVDIRRFLKFLYLRKLTAVHFEQFPTPRKTDVEKRWLEPDQIARLIAGIPDTTLKGLRDAAIISLMASSGLRVGEVERIRNSDIGPEGSISVVGKGGRRRCVFVHESTLQRVYAYINAKQRHANSQLTDQPLFTLCRSAIHAASVKWGKKILGISVNPHMLRHSFATNMAAADMEVTTIAQLMGHSDITTTTKYLHYANGRLQSLYKRHAGGWGY